MSKNLYIYIDESGDFKETSTDAQERGSTTSKKPSQVAGFLSCDSEPTTIEAEAILSKARLAAGIEAAVEFHAIDIKDNDQYALLLTTVLDEMEARGWQPIRLANQQRVVFGDRSTTYVNMVAELILKTLTARKFRNKKEINLLAATVMIETATPGVLNKLEKQEYRSRIQEYLGRLAVRRGLGAKTELWTLKNFVLGSGRKDPRLQLCDLLSNASYLRIKGLPQSVRERLRLSFGRFGFSLDGDGSLESASKNLEAGRIGIALVELLDRLDAKRIPDQVRSRIDNLLSECLEGLSVLSSDARDNELRQIVSWIDQVVDQQRDLTRGQRLAQQAQRRIMRPMSDQGNQDEGQGPYWFDLALCRAKLAAANHAGNLETAKLVLNELDALKPKVVGQWEHMDLVLGAMIHEAVHLTDAFEHEEVCRRMELVATFYSDIGGLFEDALPDVFNQRPSSRRRGEALGTWLQAEITVSAIDSSRLEKARSLSDMALAEFTAPHDLMQQRQYRAQLETVAGDIPEALVQLSQGIEAPDATHQGIAQKIKSLDSDRARGFPLLHWSRVVDRSIELQSEDAREVDEAWRFSGADDSVWVKGELPVYPAHGILRSRSRSLARVGDKAASRRLLKRLAAINKGADTRVLFLIIEACAQIEHALILEQQDPKEATEWLKKSVLPLITSLAQKALPQESGVSKYVENLLAETTTGAESGIARARSSLEGLARRVPY